MTALGILWFILIMVLITGYFVLDGFDLGVGVLYPFVGKDERFSIQTGPTRRSASMTATQTLAKKQRFFEKKRSRREKS